ncbi:hypothetical protein EW093_16635 [Thiospirochaeta perfilievii]|uniref:Uncharacterized protein n=1 Tax=Thiospirochaeta perfilievii TaxID=252967 RepID=A0A5C1QI82_9SPIO|nr:hypothetical protein [Thiospirochaeta perfilievii]QEN06246.1 hypothetical protein EW093_16635 [Thiospirochaeta perfilievii]
MRRLYSLDDKAKKKLLKLKNLRIQRKIVTTHMRTGNTSKNIELDIVTHTNSILGNVEDWLTFEGESKIGLTKTYYYSFYREDYLNEMKEFINNLS